MAQRRRLDINRSVPTRDTVLTDANLTAMELGALVTAMREAMLDTFKHGPYALYRDMRALYLEARALFMRQYLAQ